MILPKLGNSFLVKMQYTFPVVWFVMLTDGLAILIILEHSSWSKAGRKSLKESAALFIALNHAEKIRTHISSVPGEQDLHTFLYTQVVSILMVRPLSLICCGFWFVDRSPTEYSHWEWSRYLSIVPCKQLWFPTFRRIGNLLLDDVPVQSRLSEPIFFFSLSSCPHMQFK